MEPRLSTQFPPCITAKTGKVDENYLVLTSIESISPIDGVIVTEMTRFVDNRRTLVVCYNSQEPPGTLGYTLVVRPYEWVGDHYHDQRFERIVLIDGAAHFRLLDKRRESPTNGTAMEIALAKPGDCIHIPAGVAHAITTYQNKLVIQVLASHDYNSEDDHHVNLSRLLLWESTTR